MKKEKTFVFRLIKAGRRKRRSQSQRRAKGASLAAGLSLFIKSINWGHHWKSPDKMCHHFPAFMTAVISWLLKLIDSVQKYLGAIKLLTLYY